MTRPVKMKHFGFHVSRKKEYKKDRNCTRQLCTLYFIHDFYYFSNSKTMSFILNIIKVYFELSFTELIAWLPLFFEDVRIWFESLMWHIWLKAYTLTQSWALYKFKQFTYGPKLLTDFFVNKNNLLMKKYLLWKN